MGVRQRIGFRAAASGTGATFVTSQPISVGDLLTLAFFTVGSVTTGLTASTPGNTLTVRATLAVGTGTLVVMEKINAAAEVSGVTCTLAWTGAATDALALLFRYDAGAQCAFDRTAQAAGSGTAPASGATPTTQWPNEWWLAYAASDVTTNASAPGGGFALGQQLSFNGTLQELFQEVKLPGAANCAFTNDVSSNWGVIVVTYVDGTPFLPLSLPNVGDMPTLPSVT